MGKSMLAPSAGLSAVPSLSISLGGRSQCRSFADFKPNGDDNMPTFPTGISWETAKHRARELQTTSGVGYTAAFVQVAEDNAVVLPTMDAIRDWLNARQVVLIKHRVKFLTPAQLRGLRREQLFVLTYQPYELRNERQDGKMWFYCHVIPCSACQHDNRGAIRPEDAWDCSECDCLGYKLWPTRDLNQTLLTPAMQDRLRAASAEPTVADIVRDFFPPFVVRTSELGQEARDTQERDSPETAYSGLGADDPDNPDIYEDPLFN